MPNNPQSIRITHIHFSGGLVVAAPTDQWIACLFDVLHPTQQEAIIERISAAAQAQEQQPLVTIPGLNHSTQFTKMD